jgi:hypothetical protein
MFRQGLPADGPVVIRLYGFLSPVPTLVFVGAATSGKVTGDWYAQPFEANSNEFAFSALGPQTVTSMPEGEVITCYYGVDWLLQPSATDLKAIRGGSVDLYLNSADRTYAVAPKRCQIRAMSGWTFAFAVTGSPPYSTAPGPPYTCADPQGKAGVFSLPPTGPRCTVTTEDYRWGTKLWNRVERAIREAKNDFFDIINGATKKFFVKPLCEIAQHPDGKNCTVNASVGVTFGLPDTGEQQRQRAAADLQAFLDARRKLEDDPRSASTSASGTSLQTSLAAYSACVESCLAPGRAFSMKAVEEIWRTMQLPLDEDSRRYRLASLSDYVNGVLGWIPFGEAIAASLAAKDLHNTIERAQAYANALPDSPQQLLAREYVNNLMLKFGTKAIPTVGVAWVKAIESTTTSTVFSKITGLSSSDQLAIAFGFETSHPEEFFREQRDIKSAQDLAQRLINAKFKELGIPPMPVATTPE